MIDRAALVTALQSSITKELAESLTEHWMVLRQDFATRTLGRAAPGKFVETFVQVLQYLEKGSYQPKPDVDFYLKGLDDRTAPFTDDLRLCASRIARSLYTLRNKRNIAHIASIDPNVGDLGFAVAGADWIMAELLRQASGLSPDEAARLIRQVQLPPSAIIEEIGGRLLVHGPTNARDEILVLLHRCYPGGMEREEVIRALDRRAQGTVTNNLRALWQEKLVETSVGGVTLTQEGFRAAEEALRKLNV